MKGGSSCRTVKAHRLASRGNDDSPQHSALAAASDLARLIVGWVSIHKGVHARLGRVTHQPNRPRHHRGGLRRFRFRPLSFGGRDAPNPPYGLPASIVARASAATPGIYPHDSPHPEERPLGRVSKDGRMLMVRDGARAPPHHEVDSARPGVAALARAT